MSVLPFALVAVAAVGLLVYLHHQRPLAEPSHPPLEYDETSLGFFLDNGYDSKPGYLRVADEWTIVTSEEPLMILGLIAYDSELRAAGIDPFKIAALITPDGVTDPTDVKVLYVAIDTSADEDSHVTLTADTPVIRVPV